RDFARVLLGGGQRLAANELALVQLDRPPEAGLDRVDRLVELVPVEGHGRLQPARVAGPEAAPHPPATPEVGGQLARLRRIAHALVPAPARGPGLRDDAVLPLVPVRGGEVVLQWARIGLEHTGT